MRALTRLLVAFVLAAASMTRPAAAVQQPQPPVSDPTQPTIAEPSDHRLDVVLPARLVEQVPQGQQEPPDRFKPLDELPPGEQFPAGPLLVSAYGFVMLVFFAYLLSVARRLGVVQQEVDRLERDLKKSGRA